MRDAVDENDAVTVEMADRLDEAGRTARRHRRRRARAAVPPRFRIVSRTERHVEKLRTFAPAAMSTAS